MIAHAFTVLRTGSLYRSWARANPREHARLTALLAGGTVPAGAFVTLTGRGLADYARGRSGLDTLRRGRLYKRWASANPREHLALLEYVAGHTAGRLALSSATGRALLELEQAVARPRPHPLWERDLVFTANLSAWDGPRRQAAREAGFSVVAVLADELADPAAVANLRELKLIRAELERDGWNIVGWAATYTGSALGRTMKHPVSLGNGVIVDIDPEASASRAANLTIEHELAGWLANWEAWSEGPNAWSIAPWIDHYLARTGRPLAASILSSTTANYARDLPYTELISEAISVQPQVYGNAHPAYTVQAALASLEQAGVPDSLVNLTLGTYDAGHPIPWADYLTWDGPRGVYIGERMTVDDYRRLK